MLSQARAAESITIFYSKWHPYDWHALPDEIVVSICDFLDPASAVCLMLARYTGRDFMTRMLSLTLPSASVLSCSSGSFSEKVAARIALRLTTEPIKTAAEQVTALRLRRWMPVFYVYCGKIGCPPIRLLIPAEEFMLGYVDHLDCECVSSMLQMPKRLFDPRLPWKMERRLALRLLRILKQATRLYTGR